MLPKDRLILVGHILMDVDEVMIVERFGDGALLTGIENGLQITFRDGKYRRIVTDMTIQEFEALRAEKFTPVAWTGLKKLLERVKPG